MEIVIYEQTYITVFAPNSYVNRYSPTKSNALAALASVLLEGDCPVEHQLQWRVAQDNVANGDELKTTCTCMQHF